MDQVANHCGLNHWWMNDLPFPTGSTIKTVSRQESHSSIPITEEQPTKTTMRPNTIKTYESRLVCQTNARSQSAQSISSHLLNSKQHLVDRDIGLGEYVKIPIPIQTSTLCNDGLGQSCENTLISLL